MGLGVIATVGVAVSFAPRAVPDIISARVVASAVPLEVRPFFFWKERTAPMVSVSYVPEGVPFRYPSSISFCCSSVTAAPLLPFFMDTSFTGLRVLMLVFVPLAFFGWPEYRNAWIFASMMPVAG